MSEQWTENPKRQPVANARVDIELNVDYPEAPGCPLVKLDQDPNMWDWQARDGIQIVRWKLSIGPTAA